ncbi:hypothetical protein ACWIUD_11475 [Helicobacter sp. 23-1044]
MTEIFASLKMTKSSEKRRIYLQFVIAMGRSDRSNPQKNIAYRKLSFKIFKASLGTFKCQIHAILTNPKAKFP